jgi:hypothetical protein
MLKQNADKRPQFELRLTALFASVFRKAQGPRASGKQA